MTAGATGEAREIRAARNQALFRAVNEKLRTIDEAFEAENGRQAITCECADLECVQTFEIDRDAYSQVRQNARHFVVQRGHVYPEVEVVVSEIDGYVVVEKEGIAGGVAAAASAQDA